MRTLIGLVCAVWLLLGSGASNAQSTPNACGCYQDEKGGCKCNRRVAKCGCPNECEPVGCEAKREKEAARTAAAELRRIAAREKKMAADATRAAKEKRKAEEAAAKEKEKLSKDKGAKAPRPPQEDLLKDLVKGP